MECILATTSSFGKVNEKPLELLRASGFEIILNPFGRKLTEKEAMELFSKHNPTGVVAGVEPITKAVMEASASLKAICRCGIGMDSVDMEAAEQLGIKVKNTPDGPTIAVAELTVALILGLLRKIHLSDRSIRKKGWDRPMGNLLWGKIVGIIGCGRIGAKTAKLLKGFGCSIIGFDPARPDLPEVQFCSMDSLLENSDIVCLHLSYSQKSHHIIDEHAIKKMKKKAFLINTARGGLIDEIALENALKQGSLAGAALDCFESEPYEGPIALLSNVVLTGHIGSYAAEARALMEIQAAENLLTMLGVDKPIL